MSRRLRTAAAVGLLSVGLVGGGAAVAASSGPAIHTFTPTHESDITNLDVLRQQIRNYYGDPLGTGKSPLTSNYAKEARSVAHTAQRFIRATSGHPGYTTPAIVLDVDDTTLLTWNYEVASNWAYNPTTNAEYVTNQLFPPVPGMPHLVNWAAERGIAVFYLTGRPASQEAATLGNLTHDGIGVDAGYPAPTQLRNGEDGLFTKPDVNDYPAYLQQACAGDPDGKCTTVHYKAATRQHIESLGYHIIANFGDQFSDLEGGFANRTFKMPNPNYFLP
jgi:hypothetical protein